MEETVAVPVPGLGAVTAVRTAPDAPSAGWLFVYAPGAGSNVHDPFGVYVCRRLAERGLSAVRFQFPYAEAGRRRPDPTAALEAAWRAVVAAVRGEAVRLAVGGRSMGGRIASQAVAKGMPADALALFAYPLRPPGSPERARDGHLPSVGVRTLFCSGTRDRFATPEQLEAAAARVPDSDVRMLEGADHGFATLKSSGRTRTQVWSEAVDALEDWLLAPT